MSELTKPSLQYTDDLPAERTRLFAFATLFGKDKTFDTTDARRNPCNPSWQNAP